MPNYCDCDLVITGSRKQLKALKKYIKSDQNVFDFNRVLPYPEKFAAADEAARKWDELHEGKKSREERPEDGYNSGGYQWCIQAWGTKWNSIDANIEDVAYSKRKGQMELHFLTAWSPPLEVVLSLADQFPQLEFDLRYYESGVGFHGAFICENGEITRYDCGDYYGTRGG